MNILRADLDCLSDSTAPHKSGHVEQYKTLERSAQVLDATSITSPWHIASLYERMETTRVQRQCNMHLGKAHNMGMTGHEKDGETSHER